MTQTDGASMKTARELVPLLKRIAPALVCAVPLAVLTFLVMMAYHMPRPDPPAVLARSGEGSFDVYLAAWNAFQPRAYVMAIVAGAAAFAICYRLCASTRCRRAGAGHLRGSFLCFADRDPPL